MVKACGGLDGMQHEYLTAPLGGIAIAKKMSFGPGLEYRAIDAEFDVVKAGHIVVETENGVRLRLTTTIAKVFTAVDDNGNIVRKDGEPLVMVQSANIVRAEIAEPTLPTPPG